MKATVKNAYGEIIDFESAMNLADEAICDDLNRSASACESEQSFFEAYCKAHLDKYGEEFEPNKEHGEW